MWKSKRTSQHRTIKPVVNSGARDGEKVPASYETPAVVLIYTVMSGKSLVSDRGKKLCTLKLQDSLSFEIWIFRNGQPYCDDDRICFVANKYIIRSNSESYDTDTVN